MKNLKEKKIDEIKFNDTKDGEKKPPRENKKYDKPHKKEAPVFKPEVDSDGFELVDSKKLKDFKKENKKPQGDNKDYKNKKQYNNKDNYNKDKKFYKGKKYPEDKEQKKENNQPLNEVGTMGEIQPETVQEEKKVEKKDGVSITIDKSKKLKDIFN